MNFFADVYVTYRHISQLYHERFFDLINKMVSIWGMPDELDIRLLEQQIALGQHMEFAVE
jgi:hypothetical protein